MRYIFVDGYNVIRADPRLLSLERVSLERAREVLVQTLASSPRLANDAVTVVFDGHHGSRSHAHSQSRGRLTVLYSGQGQSADDLIVASARERARQGQVVVVSNDMEVRDRCRLAGCTVTGSDNLLNQVPGRRAVRDDPEDEGDPTLSTAKKGNPRRLPRRAKRVREYKF